MAMRSRWSEQTTTPYETDEIRSLTAAATWADDGHGVAIARVVQTWGSSPRPVGSIMVVTDAGEIVGSVSGGCVEGTVVQEAMDLIVMGDARVLEFGVSNEMAWGVGLTCGGTIRVLVETLAEESAGLNRSHLDELLTARREHRPVALATRLSDQRTRLIDPARDDSELAPVVREALPTDRNHTATIGHEGWFLQLFNPPLRLVLVGAVHIAQHLAPLARQTGYEVFVVDPRGAFATPQRFPDAQLMVQWPGDALKILRLDDRTALATLSHDPKIDDPALRDGLASDAFYIGALGSRRTHSSRLDRLKETGVDSDLLARIHAPIGLDIGARSPTEIALSVIAEMTQILRKGTST